MTATQENPADVPQVACKTSPFEMRWLVLPSAKEELTRRVRMVVAGMHRVDDVIKALTVKKGELIGNVESDYDITCKTFSQGVDSLFHNDVIRDGEELMFESQMEIIVRFTIEFNVNGCRVKFRIKSGSILCSHFCSLSYDITAYVSVGPLDDFRQIWLHQDCHMREGLYNIYSKIPGFSESLMTCKEFLVCQDLLCSKREELALISR
jgi:hypothetical protein